jgi:acetyl-CoA carboxylase/biotin carboxylase 1
MSVKATESGIIRHNLSPGSILSAGDLIANLQLKDPSKVKKISVFTERLTSVPLPSQMTLVELEESISLAMDGYPHDAEAAMATLFASATAETIETIITQQAQKFLMSEVQFYGKDESEVIGALAKANKDCLEIIVPSLLAQKRVQARAAIVRCLLRELEQMPQQFVDYSLSAKTMKAEMTELLANLSALGDSAVHGPVSLKAKQIIDISLIPNFETRLNSLKVEITAPKTDLYTLSKQPDTSVSVDLLVVLMSDPDKMVRHAAIEVYVRRVYRSHCVKSLSIEGFSTGEGSFLSANWSFTLRDTVEGEGQIRHGYMCVIPDFKDVQEFLPSVMARASRYLQISTSTITLEPVNVLHIAFSKYDTSLDEDTLAGIARDSLSIFTPQLSQRDVSTATFILADQEDKAKSHNVLSMFNFSSKLNYGEELEARNQTPNILFLLELDKLTPTYTLTKLCTVSKYSQLYIGREKSTAREINARHSGEEVIFSRSVTLSQDIMTMVGFENLLLTGMSHVERAIFDAHVTDTAASSRLFVNVLPDLDMPVQYCLDRYVKIMDTLVTKYATRLLKLRVDEIEVRVRVKESVSADSKYIPVRLFASSSTGGWLTREAYREFLDPTTAKITQYRSLMGDQSIVVLDPSPSSNVLQKKRSAARRVGSTYAADFLGLIEIALINTWQRYHEESKQSNMPFPPNVFHSDELVLDGAGEIVKGPKRFPGGNKVGMLAWVTVLKTPQYPEGRECVFIANDVTVQSGSFGVPEDDFFFKASEYARLKQIPRIFISCNSGARIGLVDELKPKYRVAWKDTNNPNLGFDYLYLTEEDYKALPAGTVDARVLVTSSGETHYALDAIIGQTHGIGVENLRGSGMIAGETSRAYDETFTLSYVTGRSVGIGAYLNRLGQRVIQMQTGPMILTGFSALNKLLGKEVYTSQDQLGGPQIMYPNGVTHEVVANDREGMQAVVEWLSYTPKDFVSIAPAPKGPFIDPPERKVEFIPTKTPYDPRHMLAGTTTADGIFVSGFFDKGSFKEYLGGWGKSVVTGRARLGGLNVGVIAVETRLVEQKIPADPGNPESREALQPQAGQVWYPDSAHKTAQAIQDFNRGENLPLIIFANWRGFSGGTRDMYGEVLKYGAMIVDALRLYKHPVFVYIPPNGELRGGAWVVIDPTINPAKMEMFADKESRGGILEPPGICEVKYRSPEQVKAMHRLDPTLQQLDETLSSANGEAKVKLAADVKSREKTLSPLYTQIAHEFADLHDRAGRMKAKGVISEILDWKSAREYFYWRIQRRQHEDALKSRLMASSNHGISEEDASSAIKAAIPGAVGRTDKELVEWYNSSAAMEAAAAMCKSIQMEYSTKAITSLLQGLTAQERNVVLGACKGSPAST